MASRKRRTVGPGLTGGDLEAAVWAIAAENPGLVAVEQIDASGQRRVMPIVRHLHPSRRTGRYGDLDPGQVLQTWTAAAEKVPAGVSRRRFIMELGVDRSTAYRWHRRFGLRWPGEAA